jgi:hypothetical protein
MAVSVDRGIWRNGLLFGPNDKYGGYSYADVMTIPLAEAMRDALAITAAEGSLYTPPDRSRPVVYMGLQGECDCQRGAFLPQRQAQ